jgi:hypothetical protein
MATMSLNVNPAFTLDVMVRESDKYSGAVYMTTKHYVNKDTVRGVHEMFMTPDQLELFGNFLIRQAKEIQQEQKSRTK